MLTGNGKRNHNTIQLFVPQLDDISLEPMWFHQDHATCQSKLAATILLFNTYERVFFKS